MKITCFIVLFFSFFSFAQVDTSSFTNPSKIKKEALKDYKSYKLKLSEDEFYNKKEYQPKTKYGGERVWFRIEVEGDVAVLKLDLAYKGQGWIFMDKAVFKINNEVFEFELNDVNRSTYTGSVVESKTVIVTKDFFNAVMNMDHKKAKVKLRFSGERQKDFNVHKIGLGKMKRTFEFFNSIVDSGI